MTPVGKKSEHYCTQADAIARLEKYTNEMSKILIGNGNPEDGLAFKTLASVKDRKQLHDNIKEIKEGVDSLEKGLEANTTVVTNLVTYQETQERARLVKEKEEKRRYDRVNNKRNRVFRLAGIFIALAGILAGAYFSYRRSEEVKDTNEREIHLFEVK